MYLSESRSFFEIPNDFQMDNTVRERLLCLKDFLKRCCILPVALVVKSYKTFFRGLGLLLATFFIVVTIGSPAFVRQFFINQMSLLAKDLADWILLPFALISCFFRMIMGLIVHPSIYFNSQS